MYIEGKIDRKEVCQFRKECKELGWIITKELPAKIIYLDRNCNSHELTIGGETAYIVLG